MKKVLEASRVCQVFWQEWPLDPSRINRAARSTSSSQVDGLIFVMY